MADWLVFFVTAAVIVAAGSAVAVCADVLARRTGLGGVWFGAVFVALITSLPELVTDVSAVRRGASALALGDLFGSSMANMAILAGLTLVFPTRRLLQRAALEHVLTAALAISLTALAIFFMSSNTGMVAGIALGPFVIVIAYLFGMFAIRERQAAASLAEEREVAGQLRLSLALAGFVAAAGAILLAGPYLAGSADRLAEQTGAGESFFGSFALALVTSLPELTVSVSAIRIGALNLAISNLMGSNATNMALLLPLSLVSSGNLLATADSGLQMAGGAAIALMAVGTSSIVLKAERGRLSLDLAAIVILAGYVLALWSIYEAGAGAS